jgi:hypothetical protein
MSNANHEPHLAQPGRSLDRARQERAMRHAARAGESWLEQLQRIAEQTKVKPRSES